MHMPYTRFGSTKLRMRILPLAILLANSTAVVKVQTPVTVNEERVLAARVDFVGVDPAERLYSTGYLEDFLVRDDDSVRNFMWETSRHTLQVDFDILDWVTINKRRADYPRTRTGGRQMVADAIDELSYFTDLALYDRVLLFLHPLGDEYPRYPRFPGCVASLSPDTYNTANGVFDLVVATLDEEDCVDKGSVAHELGHTYGLLHSFMVDCVKDPPLPASLLDVGEINDSCYYHGCTDDNNCTDTTPVQSVAVYGDTGEPNIMASSIRYEAFFPLHFQPIAQVIAGWLPKSQVVTADRSDTYRITTLERLDSQTKAVQVPLGQDHLGNPVSFWLQSREFSPWSFATPYWSSYERPAEFSCQVDVHLESSSVFNVDSRGRLDYCDNQRSHGHSSTYMFSGQGTELSGGQVVGESSYGETIIRSDAPFHDPYRGVLIEMLGCSADSDTRSAEIDISIQFTDLKLSPSIVARYDEARTMSTMSLTNGGEDTVSVGSVALGGRHPAAFSIDADGCSERTLATGGTCEITVSHVADEVEGNPHHFAILKIPNDDPLAPQLSVTLFGELQ